MKENVLSTLLVDNNDIVQRNTFYYEKEMNQFLKEHEGEMIASDILLLQDMGYDKKMINKIYILLQPESMERAIDLMTQVDGIYQHDFFENHNKEKDKGLCFICKKSKKYHINYVPENDINNNIENGMNEEDEKIDFNISNNDNDADSTDNFCSVCFEEMEKGEMKFNHLPCGHLCCTQCWLNYLKALISEAKVEEIKCVEHKCTTIISESFIISHIQNDTKLVEKYYKFKKRAEIINDPNKKMCPKADCDSFLQKSEQSKYVKCENGHEYCFNCLNPPHGNIECEKYMEEEFMDWKKDKRVKKCPRCKIFTEKNEGCNHMTCTSCKYQWCWLCEKEYKYDHYNRGKCKGFQFTKADNLVEAKKVGGDNNNNNNLDLDFNNLLLHLDDELEPEVSCCFTLHTFFPCYFDNVTDIELPDNNCKRYCIIIALWLFGFFIFLKETNLDYLDRVDLNLNAMTKFLMYSTFTCLYICYQILFACLITPFVLIALVYPPFLSKIYKFLEMK
jgi:hypothetical protein